MAAEKKSAPAGASAHDVVLSCLSLFAAATTSPPSSSCAIANGAGRIGAGRITANSAAAADARRDFDTDVARLGKRRTTISAMNRNSARAYNHGDNDNNVFPFA